MAVRDIFKVSRKTFINPSAWLGYDSLKMLNQTIWANVRGLFRIPEPTRTETFEEAVKRLELTEADLQQTYIRFRYYALLFVLLGLIMFTYTFYLLFRYHSITGWMLGMAVTAFFAVQAFRFDFWCYQISKRKLGVTFKEWKNHFLGIKGDEA